MHNMQFALVWVTFECRLCSVWFVWLVFGCSVGCYEIIGVHAALQFLVASSTATVAVALKFTQLHWNWAVCVCVCVC